MTNRFAINTPEAAAPPNVAIGVDLRGRHQSATVDMQTGQVTVESKGVQKADSADMGTSSPVFSRVQSRSGSIEDAHLDTMVSGPSIPGDGVRLRDALAAGFVSKDAAGNYVAGPGTFNAAKEPSLADPKTGEDKDDDKKSDDDKKTKGDDTLEGFADTKVEATLNAVIAGTNAEDQLAAVHQVTETGEVSPELIASAAQAMGMEPEVLQGQVGGIIEAFEIQARDAMTKAAGVDAQEVLEWVWEHRADALNKAMLEQGTNRSTAGYAALANDYVLNLDTIDPERILGATFVDGLSAHRDPDGKIIITGPDGPQPWKTAIRTGLLKLK